MCIHDYTYKQQWLQIMCYKLETTVTVYIVLICRNVISCQFTGRVTKMNAGHIMLMQVYVAMMEWGES